MDLKGIADTALAVVGFGLAIWQIRKTKAAAEAAKAAADQALRGVRSMYAISTMQDVVGRSRNLLNLIKSKNLTAAASAAMELRDTVSKYHAPTDSVTHLEASVWAEMTQEVDALHERLESLGVAGRWTAEEREALIHRTSRLHTKLTASTTRLVTSETLTP